MNFLVSAGPTREYIDPVRFLSNPSSGRMGVAVAEAAQNRGHKVKLVAGPLVVRPSPGIRLVRVNTAREMLNAIKKEITWADVLIMTAAVADWRPERKRTAKLKKTMDTFNLQMVRNPDILSEISKLRRHSRFRAKLKLVGFSVDTKAIVTNAKKKLQDKDLDLIVANPVSGFGGETNQAAIIDRQGKIVRLPVLSKENLAGKLVRLVEQLED